MNGREQISCDICLDLIPLVRDGVASADSEELVQNHIQTCNACKGVFESGGTLERSAIDDKRVLRRIKRGFFWAGIIILLAGAIFGASQTFSYGMFYNIIIMPLLGVLNCLLFGKRWYWLPAGLVILTPIFCLVFRLFQGYTLSEASGELLMGLIYAAIYAVLALIGCAVTMLFRFAFRREEKKK